MGQDKHVQNPELIKLFAEISQAYIEILVGLRRPEQLARWLSDKIYYEVCQKAKQEARQRALSGSGPRPDITLRKSRTFLSDPAGYEGVVLFRVSGSTKAVSLRGEMIHDRLRITELVLI